MNNETDCENKKWQITKLIGVQSNQGVEYLRGPGAPISGLA